MQEPAKQLSDSNIESRREAVEKLSGTKGPLLYSSFADSHARQQLACQEDGSGYPV